MKASAKWLDIYKERSAHDKAARWHIPVCALFKGRLVEQPKSSTPKTPETSRGEIVHKVAVYTAERIVLLLFELKLFKDERDQVAQVLLELASAYD